MANTIIQVKRSTTTPQPAGGSLSAGEIAYSYSSNVFFLGSSGGNDVLAIGGKYYVEKTNSAYTIAAAAYDQANSGSSSAAAFDKANSANYLAYLASTNAAAAFDKANSAYSVGGAAYDFANTTYSNYAYPAYVAVGPAFDKANSANYFAFLVNGNTVAAFAQANSANLAAAAAYDTANVTYNNYAYPAYYAAQAAYDKANTANYYAFLVDANTTAAFTKANSAYTAAGAAYDNANTKFSSTGGTINGDVAISGNLTLTGNTSFINVATYQVDDPLIYLASNNYTSDIVDIGFVGNYSNGACTTLHTGVFRDAGSKEWYVFDNYSEEPYNNVIDPSGNNFNIAVLNAVIKSSNISLNGTNVHTWITSAYDTANAVGGAVTTANNIAVAAYNTANAVGGAVTTANNIATGAFDKANSAYDAASAGFNKANSGYDIAVAAYNTANDIGGAVTTANNYAIAAFGKANTSYDIGVAAFITANAASAQAANADFITSGTLVVSRGGTGVNSFTSNGVLFGNGTGALQVTSAGTEGQVLQASATGVPSFAHLDGGSF